jgi:long-chain fatty acid transport protein
MKKLSILLIIGLMMSSNLMAGGFLVALQGQRQTGMAELGTGFLNGPSTLFFNPGGLSFLDDKFALELGISPIKSSVAFQYEAPSTYEAITDNPISLPFAFYATGKVNDKLSLGLGVYTPYGSSTVWGDDWVGRNILQDISLMTIYIQPTVSYQITDKLGIGIGLNYVYGSVTLNKGLPLQNTEGEEGQVNIEGSTSSFGFNAGIFFQATEKFSVGATYRSEVVMSVEGGDAKFDVPTSLATNFPPTNKFDAELPLPASYNLGFGYQVSDKLKLGFDVNYVIWSSYKSLDFDFYENTESLQDISQEKKYSDAFIYRIGGEYVVSEKFIARLGFYYDTPVADQNYYVPDTPDAHKFGYTAGFSFMPNEKFSIDASFLYVMALEREGNYLPENFSGTYKYNGIIPGIGINYKF